MNRFLCLLAITVLLGACGDADPAAGAAARHGEAAAADFERGPHRGRLLRDGDFALEVTIYETNVPPQYRLYAYQGGSPLDPAEVHATIELTRLDGEVNRFGFKPEDDYLVSSGTVVEPHSFDVKVGARHAGNSYRWSFASYEGRTTLAAAVAQEAGVRVEAAGPAVIRDTVSLTGQIVLDANRQAKVKARFPGIVRAVHVQQGQRVRRDQVLVSIEGNESMRTYDVISPFDGVILTRNTFVGDVAGDNVLIEMADLSEVWVDLHAIGSDAARLAAGQPLRLRAATGDSEVATTLGALLPLVTRGQSVVARATLPNPQGNWRPGMTVVAEVTVAERQVPLAVKESGLQRFRDFTVVFAQVGDTYEVRMLELGARDDQYAEVLGGLKPGTHYVSGQSFLIKADIEKSGASHDH